MADLTWFHFQPSHPPPGWEPWCSATAVDSDGCVYVPAGISGRPEAVVFLCMSHDGVKGVMLEKHVFAPADWMKREYPGNGDIVDMIVAKVMNAAARA